MCACIYQQQYLFAHMQYSIHMTTITKYLEEKLKFVLLCGLLSFNCRVIELLRRFEYRHRRFSMSRLFI